MAPIVIPRGLAQVANSESSDLEGLWPALEDGTVTQAAAPGSNLAPATPALESGCIFLEYFAYEFHAYISCIFFACKCIQMHINANGTFLEPLIFLFPALIIRTLLT